MRLIVNTNRVIAALIKDSSARLIINSLKADFITISVTQQEIEMHKKEILDKSGLTGDECDYLLARMLNKMYSLSDASIQEYMPKAKLIMDHIDKDDAPFIAAALATHATVWSDDKHFGRQHAVRVFKTGELMGFLTTR